MTKRRNDKLSGELNNCCLNFNVANTKNRLIEFRVLMFDVLPMILKKIHSIRGNQRHNFGSHSICLFVCI